MAEDTKSEDSYAEQDYGDVECDFCTGRKRKAKESCLVCLASYCKTHLKSHYQSPAFKKHKLVKASRSLQERICSKHDKLMEIYCRTDQSCICFMCMMDEHKGHETLDAAAARSEKQSELKGVLRRSQQILQEKETQLQDLQQSMNALKCSAQAAVKDSEKIFTDLIRAIQKKRSEVTKLIRDQEKVQLSQIGKPLKQLEREIADLKRKRTELEQLSDTEDDIQFLQNSESLSFECANTSTPISVHEHLSFDGMRKPLSDLKEQLEEFCKEQLGNLGLSNLQPELNREEERCGSSEGEPDPNGEEERCGSSEGEPDPNEEEERCGSSEGERSMDCSTQPAEVSCPPEKKIHASKGSLIPGAAVRLLLPSKKPKNQVLVPPIAVLPILPSKPTTRDDFLQYFCPLTLDPNTVHHKLLLSKDNKVVKWRGGDQRYPYHPERFDRWPQVLCKEDLSGRCYWEVEWDNGGWGVSMSASYKEISRKGDSDECAFGGNSQSWSLLCSSVFSFWHNNLETKISGPSSSRIGVYVDHSAGTLSFYSVSDTMTLLHTVHTTFTRPLYAGFWTKWGTVKLCDPHNSSDQ